MTHPLRGAIEAVRREGIWMSVVEHLCDKAEEALAHLAAFDEQKQRDDARNRAVMAERDRWKLEYHKLYDQWTALGAQYADLEKERDRLRELVRRAEILAEMCPARWEQTARAWLADVKKELEE